MKNWILANKNIIPFFVLFLLTQIVNKFGDFTGQFAKIEVAIYLIILYIPIYIYHLKKFKIENLKLGVLLLLIVPIFFEFIINEFHQNRTNIAYHDLSVMAVSAVFLLYFLTIDEPLNQKNSLLLNLILLTALVVITATLLNFFFSFDGINVNKGRFITGNQNISAYILVVSLPFIIPLGINNFFKAAYIALIILIVGLIFKARIPTIISITYGLYLLFKIFEFRNKNNYLIFSACFTILIVGFFIIFNDRFYSLINYDIYFRLLPILRLYDGLSINYLFFGVGTGNFGEIFYSIQNSYPVLELMLPTESFTYAHNFLIDRFVSAGIFLFLCYFALYIFIFINYSRMKDKSFYVQALFHAFCIGLLISLYDVVHNSISGYSIFTLVTGLLVLNLVEFQIKIKKIVFILILFTLIVPIVFFKQDNNMGHHFNYNKLINSVNKGDVSQESIKNFSEIYPHYAEIDTLYTYHRYIYNKVKSGEKDFNDALSNMNNFNKYRNARLHFSSQYYSLNSMNDDLLDVYSDIFYRNLILDKVITPLYDRQKITVKSIITTNQNISFISKPCCSLIIPKDMFDQLKYVNSGSTNLKITQESINFVTANAIYSIDSNDSVRDTKIVTKFLQEINNYSEALKF